MRIKLTAVAALATLLSSIGLYPLFVGTGWVWSGLGAILAVAGAGVLMRRFRLPAPFNFIAGLAALELYLTVRFTSEQAFLGIVPTAGSLTELADLVGDGWAAANRYAAPVPLVPGIAMLATAGVGLVAALVDLLAVRLRRAAPAGLPLLAMYSVPAAVREDSVSWLAFALGAAGFLTLLLADARDQVGGWGRPVLTRRPRERRERTERPDAGALAETGRRIGFAAIALAVLVPVAVPGIQPRGLLGLGGPGGGGGGSQTVTTPDPLVSLRGELTRTDDAEVLRYTTDDPERPDYLRLYALDRFDGDRWTYSSLQSSSRDRIADRDLPPPRGLSTAPTRAVTTKVKVDDDVKKMTFLPVPYAPAHVAMRGDWRVHPDSLMIYSLRDAAGGRDYTVRSLRTQPTPAQLSGSRTAAGDIVGQFTRVPGTVPPRVHDLAARVAKGATSQYEQARRLQEWFTGTGGFTYDLTARSPRNTSDLLDFLEGSKRGYCEQFAAAMALMARSLSIPARVAMGYTAGTPGANNEWIVRTRDAHAWPELYFEGAGWVRFEPTPSGPGGQGTASAPAWSSPADAGGQTGEPGRVSPAPEDSATADPGPTPSSDANSRAQEAGGAQGTDPQSAPEEGGLPVGPLAAALLVLALLATPMAARALARRRRWVLAEAGPAASRLPRLPRPGRARAPADPAAAAHAAWQELRADAIDHGLVWRVNDSPRAAAHRLTELLELRPGAAEAMGRLAMAEERARYARTPMPAETLRSDVRTVREAFASSVGRATRWRARLAPPSTMRSLRTGAGRALDALDGLDRLITRLRPTRRP